LDSEFFALSLMFILIGSLGIVLFSGPMTPDGSSCYCLIPSPEPGAAQGTSSIILAMGVLFFPMGLLKGGPPSFRRGGAPQPIVLPGGKVYTPIHLASGWLFGLGVVLVVLAVDAVMVPGILVLKSVPVIGAGAGLAALGILAMYFGWKGPKSANP
jgi:hypothetical protein